MAAPSLGIDLSDGRAAGVLLAADGHAQKTAVAHGRNALASVLKQLRAPSSISAVGVAVESGTPVPAKSFAVRPVICTPGTAAIVAETAVGVAQGAADAICLWAGDRVFAGLLLGGKPWLGANGQAGAAAWLALNPVERQDYRKFGSLAAEVSSNGIVHRLSWRVQSGDSSAAVSRAGKLEAMTAAHVFDAARSGDGVALSVVRETARYLGMAISNLACAIDPEVIVLGGEIADAGDLLIDPIAHECTRRLPPPMLAKFRLELSTLGVHAVAIGAARLASRR